MRRIMIRLTILAPLSDLPCSSKNSSRAGLGRSLGYRARWIQQHESGLDL